MKENLMKAFIIQLAYHLYNAKYVQNITYKIVGNYEEIEITITPSGSGVLHNIDIIYAVLHQDLTSFGNFKNGSLIITIF